MVLKPPNFPICWEIIRTINSRYNEAYADRDDAGARIIERWEHLVKTPARKATGKKLIVCNRTVKWGGEKAKEAIPARRKAHARYTLSSKSTTGWEEYGIARNKVKYMIEKKKKGILNDAVNKTNEDFGGRMKQMFVGIKGTLGKQAEEADGNSYSALR